MVNIQKYFQLLLRDTKKAGPPVVSKKIVESCSSGILLQPK